MPLPEDRMRFSGCLVLIALTLVSCRRPAPSGYQGYLEGEFVYIGAPLSGRLETLAVTKGSQVSAGTTLFTLERASELAAQRQAADLQRSAEARLTDLRKGSRPTEVAAHPPWEHGSRATHVRWRRCPE